MAERHSAAHRGGAVTLRCCAFCGVETAAWVHRLGWEKAQYRVYGKGHTWPGNVGVCDRCERLYRAGDDQTLVTVWQRTWEHSADDVRESIVNALIAFRDADLGVVSMSDWLSPGASEAATEGFVPLEDLLGEDWVGRQWPEQHRRALPETRYDSDEIVRAHDDVDDGTFWLVRSPWPEISIQDAVDLMWEWVFERQPPRSGPVTAQAQLDQQTLVRQFLHLDQQSVFEFRTGHIPPD